MFAQYIHTYIAETGWLYVGPDCTIPINFLLMISEIIREEKELKCTQQGRAQIGFQ